MEGRKWKQWLASVSALVMMVSNLGGTVAVGTTYAAEENGSDVTALSQENADNGSNDSGSPTEVTAQTTEESGTSDDNSASTVQTQEKEQTADTTENQDDDLVTDNEDNDDSNIITITYSVATGEEAYGSVSLASEEVALGSTPKGSTAAANAGYTFTNWTVDAKEVSTAAAFTPSSVEENVTYVANFEKTPENAGESKVANLSTVTKESVDVSAAKDYTWNFGSSSAALAYEGSTGMYNNMFIDASKGKLSNVSRTDKYAQINAGTKLYFPVKGNAEIAIDIYSSNAVTLTTSDGTEITGADGKKFQYTGNEDVLILTVNVQTYIASLTVTHTSEETKNIWDVLTKVEATNVTWDLGSDSLPEAYQGSYGVYKNMIVDGTIGKITPNGTGWSQVNKDGAFYIPVSGDLDATITIGSYSKSGIQAEVVSGTGTISKAIVTGEAAPYIYTFNYSGEDAVIKITSEANSSYYSAITVTYTKAQDEVIDYTDKFSFPVTNKEWDFTDNSKITQASFNASSGSYNELYIDALKGKFQTRENGATDDVQVNDGTIIVVPFNRAASMTVTYMGNNGGALTIDGTTLASGETYANNQSGYSYVALKASGQVYLRNITITYAKSALDDTTKGAIDVWDFGGAASSIAGATDHITASVYQKIDDLGTVTKKDQSTDIAFTAEGKAELGVLTLYYNKGDRIYTNPAIDGKTQQAKASKGIYNFSSSYTSAGYYYTNGTSGSGRYVTLDLSKGDVVEIYMGARETSGSGTGHFQALSGNQDETFALSQTPCISTFTAQEDGTYKIYSDNAKADFYRIVRYSSAVVSGTITFPANASISDDYTLEFTDAEDDSAAAVTAEINYATGKYAVFLTAGHTYNITLKNAAGYGIVKKDATLTVSQSDIVAGMTHNLTVEGKETVTVSGTVKGLPTDVFSAKTLPVLKFTGTNTGVTTVKIAEDGTYTANLDKSDATYTVSLANCNDYQLDPTAQNTADASQNRTGVDFLAVAKDTYKVYGDFIGLDTAADLQSLTFVNSEDKSQYKGTIDEDNTGYSVWLRNGTYTVTTGSSKYVTKTTITVNGKYAKQNLYFAKTANTQIVGSASDVYVGYTDGKNLNFDTVQEAVDAITNTRSDSSNRVTVHIHAGTYREQIIVNTPNVTFAADGTVKLTWYYGIGYSYYSAQNGYYSEEAAYNKTSKGTVSTWGAATYVKSGASGFKAEGIIFENSFNRYVTAEEIEDGVTATPSAYGDTSIRFNRTLGADVTSTSATERGTALAVDANDSEFYGCSFLGSQDTLYTGNGTTGYFRNCLIAGNTDYIFGYGDYVFEGCTLQFAGYSDGKDKHSYITANRGSGASYGYLFNNCTITGPSNGLSIGASYLGRPWDTEAKVTFKDTTVANSAVIADAGWNSMSGRNPSSVHYVEYNTLVNGTAVSNATRNGNSTVYTSESEVGFIADNYYYTCDTATNTWTEKSWVPVHFLSDKMAADSYVSYTVYFIDESGKTIQMPEVRTGKLNALVDSRSEQVTIPGYTLDTAEDKNVSLNLGKGTNTVTCTYKKADISYTVNYLNQYTGESVAASVTKTAAYGAEVTEVDPSPLGYTRTADSEGTQNITIGADSAKNVINFYYTVDTENITISYIDQDGNTIAEPVTLSKKFGETLTLADYENAIDGYTFQSALANNTQLAADVAVYTVGIANVITLQYAAESQTYTVAFVYGGGLAQETESVTVYKGGASKTVALREQQGYSADKTAEDLVFTYDLQANTTVTVTYTANQYAYTVRYLLAEDDSVLAEESTAEAAYNTTVSLTAKTIEGYHTLYGDTYDLTIGMDSSKNVCTFYYQKDAAKTTSYVIHYQDTKGNKIADDLTASDIAVGTQMTFEAKDIAGYALTDSAKASQSLTLNEDAAQNVLTFVYDIKNQAYTVNFVDKDGKVLAEAKKGIVSYGEEIAVTAPAVEHYEPSVTSIQVSYEAAQESQEIDILYYTQKDKEDICLAAFDVAPQIRILTAQGNYENIDGKSISVGTTLYAYFVLEKKATKPNRMYAIDSDGQITDVKITPIWKSAGETVNTGSQTYTVKTTDIGKEITLTAEITANIAGVTVNTVYEAPVTSGKIVSGGSSASDSASTKNTSGSTSTSESQSNTSSAGENTSDAAVTAAQTSSSDAKTTGNTDSKKTTSNDTAVLGASRTADTASNESSDPAVLGQTRDAKTGDSSKTAERAAIILFAVIAAAALLVRTFKRRRSS